MKFRWVLYPVRLSPIITPFILTLSFPRLTRNRARLGNYRTTQWPKARCEFPMRLGLKLGRVKGSGLRVGPYGNENGLLVSVGI